MNTNFLSNEDRAAIYSAKCRRREERKRNRRKAAADKFFRAVGVVAIVIMTIVICTGWAGGVI